MSLVNDDHSYRYAPSLYPIRSQSSPRHSAGILRLVTARAAMAMQAYHLSTAAASRCTSGIENHRFDPVGFVGTKAGDESASACFLVERWSALEVVKPNGSERARRFERSRKRGSFALSKVRRDHRKV